MIMLPNGRKLFTKASISQVAEDLTPLVTVEGRGAQWAQKARRIGNSVFVDCMNTPLEPKSNWFVMIHIDDIPLPIQKKLGL